MQALLNLTTALLRCALAVFRSRNEQAIVELALRQQLATYAQTRANPRLTPLDRTFWVALLRFWPRWKKVLVIVKPDTVVRWHRSGFRIYWRWISKRGPGRPRVSKEVQALIRRFARENGWGVRKVHAELAKLGFTVGLATVSRNTPKRPASRAGGSPYCGSAVIERKNRRTAVCRWPSPSLRLAGGGVVAVGYVLRSYR